MYPDDKKTHRPKSNLGYIVAIVIAVLLVVFVLRPLLQGAMSPLQTITSALSGQQR